MEFGVIEAGPREPASSSPGIAIGPGHGLSPGALAGEWSSVTDRPWQEILDEVIVELSWSAGSEELDALIESVLVCATSRQRRLSARTLAAWVHATLADRELFQRYMHDPSIAAEQRAALASDLDASGQRIEAVVSALVGAADDESAPAVPAMTACGLSLDAPDPASIEMALRAQARILEHRLTTLLEQAARLDRAEPRPLVPAVPR